MLITDLRYATIIARLIYYRHAEPLPNVDDIAAQAAYWKKYYNTEDGDGAVDGYVRALIEYRLC